MGFQGFRRTKRPGQNGQASIIVAVMMLTFILFFAFVVNTGMLVNAKINLQNAADLAAYSGAAVQARQLNDISFLNYEMRRQYKRFLFRYYVMGNMYQDSFPVTGPVSNLKLWTPGRNPPHNINYGVPAVCIVFDRNDNFCHLAAQRAIAFPPKNLLDQITQTLIAQYKEIESIRAKNCLSIGKTNLQLLTLWLFNTDPNFDVLQSQATSIDARTIQILKALAEGLGLLPRELLLRARIKTLNGYVNAPPQQGVDKEFIDKMKAAGDPPTERTVNAYLSAINTLGTHTFEDEKNIIMDELIPDAAPDKPTIAALKDVKATFDTYAVDFDMVNPTNNPNAPTGVTDCKAVLRPVTIRTPIPVGVYKDPTIMTYYAVRLRAKAKVLFSPFGDMDLKAYAAAQPFGSRIGPPLDETDFTQEGKASVLPQQRTGGIDVLGRIPNLPILEDETAGASSAYGWNSMDVMAKFYEKFKPPGNVANPNQIGPGEMRRAYQATSVPNPWEGSRYNIMSDMITEDGALPFAAMVARFDLAHQARIWAPITVDADPSKAKSEISQVLSDIFGAATKGNTDLEALLPALQQGLSRYIDDMAGGKGDADDFGIRIARMVDPFRTINEPGGGGSKIVDLDPKLMIRQLAQVRTSWPSKSEGIGRIGYSVKFVSFSSLREKLPTDGSNTWSNDLNLDPEAEADLSVIKH